MKTRLLIVAGALAIIVMAAQMIAVQAQDCSSQSCVYVSDVRSSGGPQATLDDNANATADAQTATPPPIIGTIPIGANGCEVNPPVPVEGAQAWTSDRMRGAFIEQLLCVRLVVQGRFFYNFTAHVILHAHTQDWAFDTSNGASGVAMLYLGSPDAAPGDTIPVDVAVPYSDRVYLAHTSYVVATQPTLTPTITLTPTP